MDDPGTNIQPLDPVPFCHHLVVALATGTTGEMDHSQNGSDHRISKFGPVGEYHDRLGTLVVPADSLDVSNRLDTGTGFPGPLSSIFWCCGLEPGVDLPVPPSQEME